MDKYFVEPAYIYLMMAFGILVAPLVEEIFFRGLFFPVALRYLGLSFATIMFTEKCFPMSRRNSR